MGLIGSARIYGERPVATSPDSDSSSKVQLDLSFVSQRFSGSDAQTLLSDAGFREWIASLWNSHQPYLLELAHYHLREWDRAEDVVQEMWVDFIKSLSRYEGRCSAKTWLVQILKRCIQKEKRRTVFTRTREGIFGIVERRHDDHHGRSVESQGIWNGSPEQLLLAQERLEQILRAREVLPKHQAEVWILRDISQWTSEEVSEALGLTPENERVLLHRARQRLKASLQSYFGEQRETKPAASKADDLQRS